MNREKIAIRNAGAGGVMAALLAIAATLISAGALFFATTLCISSPAVANNTTNGAPNDKVMSVTDEFTIKREYRQERVRDFYNRLDDKDQQDLERRKGEDEKRADRHRTATEDEKARQAFVQARKEKPKEDPSAFERELKERQRLFEISRAEFVKARDQMNKVMKHSGDVPEEDEYELYLDEIERSQEP